MDIKKIAQMMLKVTCSAAVVAVVALDWYFTEHPERLADLQSQHSWLRPTTNAWTVGMTLVILTIGFSPEILNWWRKRRQSINKPPAS